MKAGCDLLSFHRQPAIIETTPAAASPVASLHHLMLPENNTQAISPCILPFLIMTE
jgi:hypothetical protein